MQRTGKRVLVLGQGSRSALAVVRSLGRRGIEVHLGTYNTTGAASRSRYVRRVIALPNELKQTDAWIEAIAEAEKTYRYDLVMPTTGATTTPLNANRSRLEGIVPLALAPSESIAIAEDKSKTLELAAKLGVPTPHSKLIRNDHELDVALPQFSTPIVVKPSVSYVFHRNRWKQLSVRVAEHPEEALLAARETLLYAPVLLQEYVEGYGVGQEFLCKEGTIVYAFQHDRSHEYRGSGGSTLRVSAPLDQTMLDASKKIIAALTWDGVLMIEYRRNPTTNSFALMELNGRFWGSLALPVSLGIDFPYGWFAQKVLGTTPTVSAYSFGKKMRSVFEDMKQFFAAGGNTFGFVVEYTVVFLRLITGLERWDQFAFDDPRPFFAELGQKFHRDSRPSSYYDRMEQKAKLEGAIPNAKHILFVCYGNINRSAFAEHYARARAGGKAEFRSAGEYPEDGRPASVNAQLAAKRHGISLEKHRSSVVTPDLISWADLIFVMDGLNEQFIRETFPAAQDKTFRLGLLDSGNSIEIRDPHGLTQNAFEQAFAQIARVVDSLVQLLR